MLKLRRRNKSGYFEIDGGRLTGFPLYFFFKNITEYVLTYYRICNIIKTVKGVTQPITITGRQGKEKIWTRK